MTHIDRQQAASALSDIDSIVRRVRQSRIYNLASLMLILWGVLVFTGYVASYLWPRNAGYVWVAVYAVGIAGSFVISKVDHAREGVRTFDARMLAAFALFVAFGVFCSSVLGHFTPRQLGTFWPIYFMLVYTIAGLWAGYAFVAIGLGITALTLIGYFFAGDWFEPWMAVVNGGGLVLGGLWMRRS
jgi:FtsH-binding integral membrane protein